MADWERLVWMRGKRWGWERTTNYRFRRRCRRFALLGLRRRNACMVPREELCGLLFSWYLRQFRFLEGLADEGGPINF